MESFKDYSSLENYVSEQVEQQVFPVGTVCSLPVLVRVCGRVFVAVFLYENIVSSENTINRPFAWVRFPVDGGPDKMFGWCSALDFIPTENYPLNSQVSAHLPSNGLSEITLTVYRQELLAIVKEMSRFSFSETLDDFQRGLINRYNELFLLLSCQGLYPFYDALGADFFQWVNLLLVAKSDSELIRSQKEAELYSLMESINDQLGNNTNALMLEKISNQLKEMKSSDNNRITLSMERDVILILDHIEKNLAYIDANNPTPAGFARILKLLEGIKQDLVDLLYRQGVDPFSTSGNFFDVSRQKVIETLSTTDIQMDKKIAERLTKGWLRENHIIRPEHVKVFLFDKNRLEKGRERPKEL